MNLFQWLTIPLLTFLAYRELRGFSRDQRSIRLWRFVTWVGGALLILVPQLTSWSAHELGIGRGTDFVSYVFMLLTVAVMFHFYGCQFAMQRDIVELARREALRAPVMGSGLAERLELCNGSASSANRNC